MLTCFFRKNTHPLGACVTAASDTTATPAKQYTSSVDRNSLFSKSGTELDRSVLAKAAAETAPDRWQWQTDQEEEADS